MIGRVKVSDREESLGWTEDYRYINSNSAPSYSTVINPKTNKILACTGEVGWLLKVTQYKNGKYGLFMGEIGKPYFYKETFSSSEFESLEHAQLYLIDKAIEVNQSFTSNLVDERQRMVSEFVRPYNTVKQEDEES